MLHRLHRLTNATVQKNDKESTKNSLQFKTLVRQTVNYCRRPNPSKFR